MIGRQARLVFLSAWQWFQPCASCCPFQIFVVGTKPVTPTEVLQQGGQLHHVNLGCANRPVVVQTVQTGHCVCRGVTSILVAGTTLILTNAA